MPYGDPPRLPWNDATGHLSPGDACNCLSCTTEPLPYVDAPPLALDEPKQLIVGFWSPVMGSGKSTAANRLIEAHGYQRGKFAGALKEMLRTMLRYRGVDEHHIERMIEGDLKEVQTPALNGQSPRWAMQSLGTEWGRKCIHPEIWVDTELQAKSDVAKLVFDDVRYPNEADAIRAAGGFIVGIDRPGIAMTGAGHSSEGQAIDCDFHLLNHSTQSDFVDVVDEFARNLTWTVARLNDR